MANSIDVTAGEKIELAEEERSHLADIIESSLRVHKRHQFYSWTQGVVQTLMPHDILICGVSDGTGLDMVMHYFSITRYFRDEHFVAVCHPQQGLIPHTMGEWHKSHQPFLLAPELSLNPGAQGLITQLEQNELRNIVAHGLCGANGKIMGYFSFSRVKTTIGPAIAYRVQILLPYLHATFSRVLREERKAVNPGMARPIFSITQREAEILKWIKEGKTNGDIAQILNLSHWTIKNHVRSIFKKMSVQNRSHALSKAMSLGFFDSM